MRLPISAYLILLFGVPVLVHAVDVEVVEVLLSARLSCLPVLTASASSFVMANVM